VPSGDAVPALSPQYNLKGHRNPVNSIAFHPVRPKFCTIAALWHRAECSAAAAALGLSVWTPATFEQNFSLVVSAAEDATVIVWDTCVTTF
jgi:WD40 repeat protein